MNYFGFVIDVREAYMSNFKMFSVKNVIYIPLSTLKDSFHELPHEIPLIFADTVGLHSREAVLFMMEQGYSNVANLSGGIIEWERDCLPVTTDKSYRLSGSCMCQLKTREA
jgi:rhodanese-related sulfurtransferase